MPLSPEKLNFFLHCAEEIINTKDFQSMSGFVQHGSTSCLEHSLYVAYYSYYVCQKLHLPIDCRSVIRGALLHDFFLYDWHYNDDRKGLHGFTHPKTALKNAQALFTLTEREEDIILKHMWPLTIILPRYKETFIVSLIDKYCSTVETLKLPLLDHPFFSIKPSPLSQMNQK